MHYIFLKKQTSHCTFVFTWFPSKTINLFFFSFIHSFTTQPWVTRNLLGKPGWPPTHCLRIQNLGLKAGVTTLTPAKILKIFLALCILTFCFEHFLLFLTVVTTTFHVKFYILLPPAHQLSNKVSLPAWGYPWVRYISGRLLHLAIINVLKWLFDGQDWLCCVLCKLKSGRILRF